MLVQFGNEYLALTLQYFDYEFHGPIHRKNKLLVVITGAQITAGCSAPVEC